MIRKAEYTDIKWALDIYDSARRFMRSRGNAVQWVNGYPSEALLRADVAAGQLYVMEDAGGVYAVFAFIIGDDPTYQAIDGAWLDDGTPYGTLHRLASAGTRKGVATDIIDWCLEHCQTLRADTHADNKIMQRILEQNGFTRCGIIHVANGTPRIAYQKLALTQPLG